MGCTMKLNIILTLFFAILVSSCTSHVDGPPSLSIPRAIPSATLLSSFVLTPQHAQANAQSTIAAGQAVRSDLDITATALALQGLQANQRATKVSSQITQAAATENAFIRQTEVASNTTATSKVAIGAINAAIVELTQSAAETATTWPQTATPLAATQLAIISEAANTERRAYWNQFIVPFRMLFFGTILVLLLVGFFYFYRRFLPVLELRLRTIVSPDGETITYLPAREEIKALIPGRSFGAAMHSRKEETIISGVASDPVLQDRVVARNQAARLMASLPPCRTPQEAQHLLSPPENGQTTQTNNLPTIEVLDAEVIPVKNWIEEVSEKFLKEE